MLAPVDAISSLFSCFSSGRAMLAPADAVSSLFSSCFSSGRTMLAPTDAFFFASSLILIIGILAYKAGAPVVPSSFVLFASLTSISFSSTSIYFLITSIISCFIKSRKSADTFALSCIKTRCSLSFAASFE